MNKGLLNDQYLLIVVRVRENFVLSVCHQNTRHKDCMKIQYKNSKYRRKSGA
jgi:hypothetical protein